MKTKSKDKNFVLEYQKPIRFLAIEWREPWEFDHPTVLLEPIFRYSPNGTSLENMVEDAAIDISINFDMNKPTVIGISKGEQKEFTWRRWNKAAIRRAAEASLRGEKVKLGLNNGYVGVLEQYFVFKRDKYNETIFEEVDIT